ncbi:MAG TPA: amidophosphoribosyltransferase [Bacteroidetes bacterium]|nr:amidophosphoribosyltransferase [Bacteroidota bacterium]
MSDAIQHECGIVLIRLKKSLEYYRINYGSWQYGLKKLYLLMEKQHNRGQDGAGAVCLKMDMPPGEKYLFRYRSNADNPIQFVFSKISKKLTSKNQSAELIQDPVWAKENIPFAGELYIGHLRYGTFGKNSIEHVHPVMRENNWRSRNLVLAGNFNMTNTDELFNSLLAIGQTPKDISDTVTVLENVGHFLDEENESLFRKFKRAGYSKKEISPLIEENLDVGNILRKASKHWDGGYVITGMIGHGDAFVLRDPWGIRPAFYYEDDDIVVSASERPVIQTALNVPYEKVKEIAPGQALIIKKNGKTTFEQIRKVRRVKSCSFERIYFSRGGDADIYKERKKLGELLVPHILKVLDNDLDNTVFSYIPNTAESAFYGMIKGLEDEMNKEKVRKIMELSLPLDPKKVEKIMQFRPRVEKVAIKDIKLRTFIAQDAGRKDMVGHVYDVTYGIVRNNKDNLVVIDDSIVRGTTLRESIIRILDRLNPKKIIVVSSSPQIRYPDCYGIDMAKLSDFIAFRAAIELLKETGRENIINNVYLKAREQDKLPKEKIRNYVKEIYKPFTPEELSDKIGAMLKTQEVKAEVKIVYQTIENLHKAIPNHSGDWYFTGDYPTPGGNRVANRSFINYIEGRDERAY